MKHVVVYTKVEQWTFDCDAVTLTDAYLAIEHPMTNGAATRDRVIFPHGSYEFARIS